MTEEKNKKRRAEEQLSPYSKDLKDELPAVQENPEPENHLPRKARARRNRDAPVQGEKLKGIFGKVSLSTPGSQSQGPAKAFKIESNLQKTNDLVAGINRSFLKALNRVIEKQANKDLTYLFRQYEDFIHAVKNPQNNG
ncbi:hypothetical protein PAEPH01_0865 [Pancytospora epiphaga]|nr:hypothetical protein PAEPH01_0865 [Pancytospora epiphaga]